MSEPKRVLLVFGKLNRGGAETLAMNIFRCIDRTRIVFDFIKHTEEKSEYDDEILSLGGRIYSIPRYNGINHFKYKKIWNDFFINHPEYSIIHAHMTGSASVFLPIAKKHGLFTISHSHIADSQKGFHQLFVDLYRFPLPYCSDYMFACSQIAGEWLFGKNIAKRDNYRVINNGVDTEKFRFNESSREEIRREFGIKGKFVIGNISRFHLQKNHSFLIDIFAEAYKRNENAVLMLVGNGELQEEIQKKADSLGLHDAVIFTSVRSDVDRILSAIDVFCMPSFREGLPVSLVEAQASGLHIVGSDTISKEIKLTSLVEFCSLDDSPAKWAEVILKYADGYERADTSQEIIDAGYDINATTKWLLDFYEEKS